MAQRKIKHLPHLLPDFHCVVEKRERFYLGLPRECQVGGCDTQKATELNNYLKYYTFKKIITLNTILKASFLRPSMVCLLRNQHLKDALLFITTKCYVPFT